jgi:hypothetical protein
MLKIYPGLSVAYRDMSIAYLVIDLEIHYKRKKVYLHLKKSSSHPSATRDSLSSKNNIVKYKIET